MKISYASYCQVCKVAGKESRLHRELTDPETVFCSEGHKFSGPEIEDYLTAEPDVQAVPAPKPEFVEPPLPAEVTEIQESMQKAFDESFAMAPPPQADPAAGSRTAASVLAQREEAAGKIRLAQKQPATKIAPGTVIETSQAPVATLVEEPSPEPQPAPKPSQKPARELPGGVLELVVRIPDPDASYLKGEAEFRGKKVEEFFQEMVEFGLSARWFY